MKHCQSELVSRKVEWFCSLAVFSWWPSLSLYFSLFFPSVSVSLFPLFSFSFVLVPFLKSREKGSALEGREVREHQLWPITVVRVDAQYLLRAVRLWETRSGLQPPASLATSATTCFHHRSTILSLHPLFVCLARVFVLICIQLSKKTGSVSSILFYQAEYKQPSVLCDNTLPL